MNGTFSLASGNSFEWSLDVLQLPVSVTGLLEDAGGWLSLITILESLLSRASVLLPKLADGNSSRNPNATNKGHAKGIL